VSRPSSSPAARSCGTERRDGVDKR
jgi:hypothetical protein